MHAAVFRECYRLSISCRLIFNSTCISFWNFLFYLYHKLIINKSHGIFLSNQVTKGQCLTRAPVLSLKASVERGGGRRVRWGWEGPLRMASASIHSMREDLALGVIHKPEIEIISHYQSQTYRKMHFPSSTIVDNVVVMPYNITTRV